jgi:hypothetical protein
MFRQTLLRQTRLFSTSVRVQKSAVDAAKDTIKSADKAVSQKIVQGIEATGMSPSFSQSSFEVIRATNLVLLIVYQ